MGKAHYRGKDVTEVRSPHRQLLPDTVGPEDQKPTSLRGIANKAKADKRHRFRDLYRCLDAELLLDCWQDLNKEAASGVDHVTAGACAGYVLPSRPSPCSGLSPPLSTMRDKTPHPYPAGFPGDGTSPLACPLVHRGA